MTYTGGWFNQQLLKDCGVIPWLLAKNHGFRSVMVGAKVEGENYPYLEYVSELEMNFLAEDNLQSRINYIDEHAKEFDLMILYGAYPQYIPLVAEYKKIRPDGKIYLATDMNIGWADRTEHESPEYKFLLESCDIVAASCRATQKYLSAKWHIPIDLLRNGWYNFPKASFDNLFDAKEKIILTVGRIGTYQKQNNILLEAFAEVADELPDWKVRLVGNIEEDFQPYIKKYFEKFPELENRVNFVGLIEDKIKLIDEYKHASIFCLTSNMEGGGPNVAGEALYSGCFAITSAIDAADDITDENRCGRTFPIGNVHALADIFREVCTDEKLLLEGGHWAAEYARREFDAEKIVARLNYLLYGGAT